MRNQATNQVMNQAMNETMNETMKDHAGVRGQAVLFAGWETESGCLGMVLDARLLKSTGHR